MNGNLRLEPLSADLVDEYGSGPGGKNSGKGGPGLRDRLADALSHGVTRYIALLVMAVVIVGGGWRFWKAVGPEPQEYPRIRVKDSQNGSMHWVQLRPDKRMPYRNPRTGENTLYPVEYCFDNTCGPAGGTAVILNVYLGSEEATTCPECGASVTGHNPRPEEFVGVTPADQEK